MLRKECNEGETPIVCVAGLSGSGGRRICRLEEGGRILIGKKEKNKEVVKKAKGY